MTLLVVLAALLLALALWFAFEKSRRKTHPVTGGLHADITLPHSAEFELYGNAFSHCSRKTRLVMAELGIPYTHKPIDLIETGSYQPLSPEYLKINPSGLIPTLVHNGHPVYESDDILAYAARHARPGASKLVPDDPDARARMQTWIDFCNLSSADPTGDMERRMGACVPPLTLPLFLTAIRYIPLHRILVGLLFHPNKERPIFFTAGKLFGLKRMLAQKPLQRMLSEGRRHMPIHLARLDRSLKESAGPWILGGQRSPTSRSPASCFASTRRAFSTASSRAAISRPYAPTTTACAPARVGKPRSRTSLTRSSNKRSLISDKGAARTRRSNAF